ncbi:hypothetical protein HETIRDRAFT_456288 [Heterobasidion irregulare TC 32-1]|uniref:Uncharacterized protein n=1 Tax=Heterobasidion irregulare (strain TC 32-1) TaxID=747525 RepID=W4JNU4_HETIT|nr:uncharacterized protein HETIRDRAFT_456288 [Heterobasidion irregulare TC 32-1]ETW74735.1 hypothetical protein HETIRDRAFT_456288 [Heterobasidion irregulare TC 32-1]
MKRPDASPDGRPREARASSQHLGHTRNEAPQHFVETGAQISLVHPSKRNQYALAQTPRSLPLASLFPVLPLSFSVPSHREFHRSRCPLSGSRTQPAGSLPHHVSAPSHAPSTHRPRPNHKRPDPHPVCSLLAPRPAPTSLRPNNAPIAFLLPRHVSAARGKRGGRPAGDPPIAIAIHRSSIHSCRPAPCARAADAGLGVVATLYLCGHYLMPCHAMPRHATPRHAVSWCAPSLTPNPNQFAARDCVCAPCNGQFGALFDPRSAILVPSLRASRRASSRGLPDAASGSISIDGSSRPSSFLPNFRSVVE